MRTKAPGIDPFAATRAVRRGVIEGGAIKRGELLAEAKREFAAAALTQLQELAGSDVDVRSLSARDYRARRQLALRLARQATIPRP